MIETITITTMMIKEMVLLLEGSSRVEKEVALVVVDPWVWVEVVSVTRRGVKRKEEKGNMTTMNFVPVWVCCSDHERRGSGFLQQPN